MFSNVGAQFALPDRVEKRVHFVLRSVGVHLDTAIAQIFYPARDIKAFGDVTDGVTEADSLDISFEQDLRRTHGQTMAGKNATAKRGCVLVGRGSRQRCGLRIILGQIFGRHIQARIGRIQIETLAVVGCGSSAGGGAVAAATRAAGATLMSSLAT